MDAATFPTKFEELIFESPDAFPMKRPPDKTPVTISVAILVVARTLRLDASKLDTAPLAALSDPVLHTFDLTMLKNAVFAPNPPVTLAVVNQPLEILALPETLRLTRVPSDVIFDCVFES